MAFHNRLISRRLCTPGRCVKYHINNSGQIRLCEGEDYVYSLSADGDAVFIIFETKHIQINRRAHVKAAILRFEVYSHHTSTIQCRHVTEESIHIPCVNMFLYNVNNYFFRAYHFTCLHWAVLEDINRTLKEQLCSIYLFQTLHFSGYFQPSTF